MRSVKWGLLALVLAVVGALIHYTLPQRDVVRIVNTEIRRMDISGPSAIFWSSPDSGTVAAANRDIRFLEAVRPNGDPAVYRNEDTGWGWPFFFKFDSADLQAQAADYVSTRDAPLWVSVRHYGWRSRLLSTFPNALAVERVDGPDALGFPWRNTVFLIVLALVIAVIWRLSRGLWRHRIAPFFGRFRR